MRDNWLETERVAMQFRKFGQQIAVDAGIMAEMDLTVGQDSAMSFLRDEIMVRMVAKILTDDLPPETVTKTTRVDCEIPASTWQMWKLIHAERWYARRLVDKWPVRYAPHPEMRQIPVTCTFTLERYRAYPKARVTSPVLGQPVLFHTIRGEHWDRGQEGYHG